jgi:predicted dehydrogenase
MAHLLKWGILGTGNIARQFSAGVRGSLRGQLAAVGSRNLETAQAFAQTFQIPSAVGSYDRLLTDPNIDVVYISLPNSMHYEWTLKALRAGKHVLCEKPLATNLAQAQEMFDVAQKAGRVLVEAFMYRTHPQTHAMLRAVREGAIGQLRLIRTSFCYRTRRIDGNIRFDPALAGGALMDIGCYCIDFSRLVAGQEPASVHAFGKLHERGVDEMAVGTLRFPSGIVASFTCGMCLQADNTASICGDDGYIEIPWPWKPPAQRAEHTLARSTPPRMDGNTAPVTPPRETRYVDAGKDLYALEADDFAGTVLDNKPPFMSRRDTLANMRILDELRRQIGVIA